MFVSGPVFLTEIFGILCPNLEIMKTDKTISKKRNISNKNWKTMEGCRMQKWLKRAGLILFFGLWAAAGLQIWAKKQENKEMEAVAAFSDIGTEQQDSIVQYYGR